VLLDAKTFLKALTADVQQFDTGNKDKLSTNFDDALYGETRMHNNQATEDSNIEDGGDSSAPRIRRYQSTAPTVLEKRKIVDDIALVYTAPHLDNAADTFKSRPLVVLQWTFFVLSFQTYLIRVLNREVLQIQCDFDPDAIWIQNAGAFFCTVAVSVLRWIIIMLAMSAVGLLYIGIGGIGNNIESVNPYHPLIGAGIAFLYALLPPLLASRNFNDTTQQYFLQIVTLILGCCSAALTLWQSISLWVPRTSRLWTWLRCILIPEAFRTERHRKHAANFKINKMVKNALDVHSVKKQESVIPTHFGQALFNFSETTPEYERVGGLRWTAKSIWNQTLFTHEGVLLSGRLISTNAIQFVVTIFILIYGVNITKTAATTFDDYAARVQDFLATFAEIDVNPDSFRIFLPTDRNMIVVPIAIGVAFAFLAALLTSIIVIPSASLTTLKFRSGILRFAHDPKVKLLRIAPDQVAFLRGVMFWGTLFGPTLLGAALGIIIFFFMWQVTAAKAQALTASLIGALVVIGLHITVNRNIRKVAASAYYRKKPSVANVTILIRECGLVALTQGFVVFRIIRLFLTTCFYIGRLDTPFLYNSVGHIGGYRVDGEPYMFQIDILQHEAHRHPYIETLGTMYLLMLRHRDKFCNEAGSCWRLIFVYVLMPWLSKYRSMRRPPSLEHENGGSMPPSLSLRAVSLFDPHAYGGRVGSLVPGASRWAGGPSIAPMAGQKTRNSNLTLLEDSDEDENIDELREEVRQLRIQLQLQERHTSGPEAEVPTTRKIRFDSNTPKPGWEDDYDDYVPHRHIEEKDSFGLEPEEEPVRAPFGVPSRPSVGRREMSEGLMPMPRPAAPRKRKDSWDEDDL
jgi:hypothetical protein